MIPPTRPAPALTIDALGRKCPIPIIMLAERIREIPIGATIAVLADDPAARPDIPAPGLVHDEVPGIRAGDGAPARLVLPDQAHLLSRGAASGQPGLGRRPKLLRLTGTGRRSAGRFPTTAGFQQRAPPCPYPYPCPYPWPWPAQPGSLRAPQRARPGPARPRRPPRRRVPRRSLPPQPRPP